MEKLTEVSRSVIRSWVTENNNETLTYAEMLSDIDKLHKKLEAPKPQKTQLADSIVKIFGRRDPAADPAIDAKGKMIFDPELKDSENVPLSMDIDEYMATEVLPYAPDAVVDETVIDEKGPLADGKVGQVGTSISFNRYFYKYENPRDPDVIAKEILELEEGLGSLMRGFLA